MTWDLTLDTAFSLRGINVSRPRSMWILTDEEFADTKKGVTASIPRKTGSRW